MPVSFDSRKPWTFRLCPELENISFSEIFFQKIPFWNSGGNTLSRKSRPCLPDRKRFFSLSKPAPLMGSLLIDFFTQFFLGCFRSRNIDQKSQMVTKNLNSASYFRLPLEDAPTKLYWKIVPDLANEFADSVTCTFTNEVSNKLSIANGKKKFSSVHFSVISAI